MHTKRLEEVMEDDGGVSRVDPPGAEGTTVSLLAPF